MMNYLKNFDFKLILKYFKVCYYLFIRPAVAVSSDWRSKGSTNQRNLAVLRCHILKHIKVDFSITMLFCIDVLKVN